MRDIPVLYGVIPYYNEANTLPVTAPLFLNKIQELIERNLVQDSSRILFVDDGSKDDTWQIISTLAKNNKYFAGIAQSRNRGHQNAVLAGLMESKDKCDITISIDCDGQDDLNAMNEMVKKYLEGFDVVYGVRNDRSSDTFFKRFTAEAFYKLLRVMGVEVVFNHADYRLLSARVAEELGNFKEVNIYLRGMIPLIGFSSTEVYYERHERMAGKSHYPLTKMLELALNGITSLSIKPIRIISSIGLGVSALSFLMIIWTFVRYFQHQTVPGWASTLDIICLMGGLQLICLGVLGEYIGKIYMETKDRPRYIISRRTDNMEENDELDK